MSTPEDAPQKGLWYGQHENRIYWIGGIVFFAAGMVGGYFISPDEWPMWRQLTAGGVFGLWCGYCIFAWRLLFYDTVADEDE